MAAMQDEKEAAMQDEKEAAMQDEKEAAMQDEKEAAMQDEKEQAGSLGNCDRQGCPPCAEEDNEKEGPAAAPGGRFGKGNRAATGHGPPRKKTFPRRATARPNRKTSPRSPGSCWTRPARKEWAVRLALQYLVGPPSSMESKTESRPSNGKRNGPTVNQAKRVTAGAGDEANATRVAEPDDVSPRRWKQILRMLAEGKIDPEPWPTIAAALEDYALRPPRSILDAPDPFLIAAIELGRPKTGHAGSRAADRAIRYSDEELELIILAALEKVELSAAETADRADPLLRRAVGADPRNLARERGTASRRNCRRAIGVRGLRLLAVGVPPPKELQAVPSHQPAARLRSFRRPFCRSTRYRLKPGTPARKT